MSWINCLPSASYSWRYSTTCPIVFSVNGSYVPHLSFDLRWYETLEQYMLTYHTRQCIRSYKNLNYSKKGNIYFRYVRWHLNAPATRQAASVQQGCRQAFHDCDWSETVIFRDGAELIYLKLLQYPLGTLEGKFDQKTGGIKRTVRYMEPVISANC